MRRYVAIALVVAAGVIGVYVGLWEAHFWVESTGGQVPIDGLVTSRPPPTPQPQFARWLCALVGAVAAAIVGLIALAVDRWPQPTYSN